MPKDIQKLKDDIKTMIKKHDAENAVGIKDSIKRSLTTHSDHGLQLVFDICKNNNINIYKATTTTVTDSSGVSSYYHHIIGKFKDYVLKLDFAANKFNSVVLHGNIDVLYDSDKCNIPKNVVFDIIAFAGKINSIKSKENSVKFSCPSAQFDSMLKKTEAKYGDKYVVKKNFGGMSMTISIGKEKDED